MEYIFSTWFFALLTSLTIFVYAYFYRKEEQKKTILRKRYANALEEPQIPIIDQVLNKLHFLCKSEARLDKNLKVLDLNYNARTITKVQLSTIFIALLIALYINNIVAIIPLSIMFWLFPKFYITAKMKKRVSEIDDLILEAFQLFIGEYVSHNSVRLAITNICPKLQGVTKKKFEALSRRINSGVDISECFIRFSEETQSKWTMLFSQMMITYFRTGGDFVPHLLNISKTIANQKVMKEKNNTEVALMKTINIFLNISVPIAFVGMRIFAPKQIDVFLYDPAGKKILLGIIIVCFISLLLGKKVSDM